MANQLGALVVAPREYNSHQRHSKLTRRRYDNAVKTAAGNVTATGQMGSFLSVQATRLSSTPALIFAKLTKNTAARIKAAATFGSLA